MAFIRDETISSISKKEFPNIYQIVIEKRNFEKEPLDSSVSKTIERIIELFFRNEDNALIYFCSDIDKKADLRFKLFNRWYLKSRFKHKILKIDNTVQIGVNDYVFTSFLLHKNNSNFEELISIFKDLKRIIEEEK